MTFPLEKLPAGLIVVLLIFCSHLVYPDENVAGICARDVNASAPGETESKTITALTLENCRNREECHIKKGADLVVRSFSFTPKTTSPTVNLTVLMSIPVGATTDKVKAVEFGVPEEDMSMTDVCSAIVNDHKCPVHNNDTYSLPPFKFYIGRLLPQATSSSVNLTFMLIGNDTVLGCGMVQATFFD